jgi:hypothetical protein
MEGITMNKTLSAKSHIDVSARKWFDKVNGNTYHAVKVVVTLANGSTQELVSSHIVYGYGNQWEQTACEMLRNAGYRLHPATIEHINKRAGYAILRSPEIVYGSFFALHQYGKMLDYSVSDGCLKRELKELVS